MRSGRRTHERPGTRRSAAEGEDRDIRVEREHANTSADASTAHIKKTSQGPPGGCQARRRRGARRRDTAGNFRRATLNAPHRRRVQLKSSNTIVWCPVAKSHRSNRGERRCPTRDQPVIVSRICFRFGERNLNVRPPSLLSRTPPRTVGAVKLAIRMRSTRTRQCADQCSTPLAVFATARRRHTSPSDHDDPLLGSVKECEAKRTRHGKSSMREQPEREQRESILVNVAVRVCAGTGRCPRRYR